MQSVPIHMRSEDTAPPFEDFSGATHGGVDWQELAHAVRERLWILILCVVLALIGATYYLSQQKEAYQARSVLFIEQEQAKLIDPTKFQDVRPDAIQSLDMINTVVDLLRSFPFAERVAARLKLQSDPRFQPLLPARPGVEATASDAGGVLRSHVGAEYRLKTRLIDVVANMPEATLADDVANAYIDEYIRYGFERKAETNRGARQFLLEESERLRRDLRTSEEAMQSFRERNQGLSLEDMQGTAQIKINDLNRAMGELENKSQQLDTDLQVATAHPNDSEALLRLPSVATQPKVTEINQQINDLDRQFTLLKQRYRAKFPLYIATQTQLNSLIRDRNQLLQDVVGILREGRQQMLGQIDALKKQRDDVQTHLLAVAGKTAEYNDIKRTVDTNKALYDSVAGRVSSLDVTAGMTESPVRVHERAVGASPVRVTVYKVYTLGTLAGLAAGLAIALGLHFMDRSVKTIDQAERVAGVPVLAAVPRKGRKDKAHLDMVSDREGMVAESFRTLRTSLAMAVNADERRIFMFTSAVPSEGKTFCSSNFAVTMAQQGFRTLLIDGDLRRPMVSRVFFGEQRRPGLVDALAGQSTLKDAALPTEIDGLMVLSAGNRAPNPAELLSAGKLGDILKEACQTYDRVIVDSAPVLAVSDALLIAPHMDVTCLVLRSFKTPRKTFTRAIKALDDINCKPVGVVFNFLPTGVGSYYYYSGKYHGDYGTKGVYGT